MNAFHGEAFDYLRNNWLDARNYFNRKGTRQASLIRNNFGGALGGPIWKDKVWAWGSFSRDNVNLLTADFAWVKTVTQPSAAGRMPVRVITASRPPARPAGTRRACCARSGY